MYQPTFVSYFDENNWSPVYDVSAILVSLQSLLVDPNPKSPANVEAARFECLGGMKLTFRLFETDKAAYNNKVTEFVEKTWDAVDSD